MHIRRRWQRRACLQEAPRAPPPLRKTAPSRHLVCPTSLLRPQALRSPANAFRTLVQARYVVLVLWRRRGHITCLLRLTYSAYHMRRSVGSLLFLPPASRSQWDSPAPPPFVRQFTLEPNRSLPRKSSSTTASMVAMQCSKRRQSALLQDAAIAASSQGSPTSHDCRRGSMFQSLRGQLAARRKFISSKPRSGPASGGGGRAAGGGGSFAGGTIGEVPRGSIWAEDESSDSDWVDD